MSSRDPFYEAIERALASALDTDLFEQLAAEIVESKGYPTNLAVGGKDFGYDFELLHPEKEPGPGIVTTSDRVTSNLRKNLTANRNNCPRAARITFVVTSAVLTSAKRNNLKKVASELGYEYRGAADRPDVAKYIYANPHWAKRLLGLAGEPSALSAVARTSRPLVNIPLVGRDMARQSLRELQGDAMVVGSPGSGKTALLADFVAEAEAFFMVGRDMTAVANAIRAKRPAVVIIDDLDDIGAATRDLVHLRTEIDAEYRIVVTDWERNPELEQALGLAEGDVIMLDRLTRDQVVEVVKSVGIAGPSHLVREIVNQSEGMPGLAVTLTQAALSGDYQALFDGERLGVVMESAVNRLLGNPKEGHQAVLALGSVALAGDAGLTLEEIADFLGASKNELQGLLRRLTSGGVIRLESRCVTLRPPPLRRYMIRKAFFGAGPADFTPLLDIVRNMGQTATELVLAERAGAVIPGLLAIVISSGDKIAARYFVGSGERQALELLEAAPDLAIDVAREALHTAPNAIIPMLLALAVGDSRELHNTPDQPLRLIGDWANSAMPGSCEAVERKRAVIERALRWAEEGGEFETACRACCEVLRTSFEDSEADPGEGRTFCLVSGMLSEEEIAQLTPLWGQVRRALERAAAVPWPSLLSLVSDLTDPRIIGNCPDEVFAASRDFARRVYCDLGELGRAHPAVLARLNALRDRLELEEVFRVPHDYVVLLGARGSKDWRRDDEQRVKQIEELAEQWAVDSPQFFAARMRWLADEAAIVGEVAYDYRPYLCYQVAQRVGNPQEWLSAVIAAGLSPSCQQPFVDRAIEGYEEGWEELVSSLLGDPLTAFTAINSALRAPEVSDEMWSSIAQMLPGHKQHIDTLCSREQVSLNTLRRLLSHDSAVVGQATALGMWIGGTHGAIPEVLRQEWEDAVVGIDDDEYRLEEILAASDPDLATRWLLARIENNDWRALRNRKNVESACRDLGHGERLCILRSLPGNVLGEPVAAALFDDSADVYREVLRDPSMDYFWKAPLRRNPDDHWRCYAAIALAEGKIAREVAGASMLHHMVRIGPESSYLQARIDAFSPWLEDPCPGIQQVAKQAINSFSASREQALAREKREAIEGWG